MFVHDYESRKKLVAAARCHAKARASDARYNVENAPEALRELDLCLTEDVLCERYPAGRFPVA